MGEGRVRGYAVGSPVLGECDSVQELAPIANPEC